MRMNQIIKSSDGVKYSIHKTVRGGGGIGSIHIHKPNNATCH